MQFEGISDASQAVTKFYYTGVLPEPASKALGDVVGMTRSPVDAVVKAAEVLYAHRDKLDDAGKELAAACASLAASHGFHGMDVDSRGDLMALTLRGKKLPSGAKAPEVLAEYVPIPTISPVV